MFCSGCRHIQRAEWLNCCHIGGHWLSALQTDRTGREEGTAGRIQETCLQRLTATVKFTEGVPPDLVDQIITKSCVDHPERYLLASVYGHLGQHELLRVRTDAEKYWYNRRWSAYSATRTWASSPAVGMPLPRVARLGYALGTRVLACAIHRRPIKAQPDPPKEAPDPPRNQDAAQLTL